LIPACLLLMWVSPLYAQDTSHTQHAVPDHSDHSSQHEMPTDGSTESMPAAHDHQAMQQMQMETSQPVTAEAELRDPHGYSGGYVRGSGPYTLAPEDQLSLADEMVFTGLWVDRFEYVESHDIDATEFEGHAWIGDSYNRFLLRSEIEIIEDTLDVAEIDLLHSRAISPFWDLRLGVRREVRDEGHRNWASIGLAGLAPYWFEIDASLFVGEGGNTLLDIEAEYDLLLTQRLVMQPRLDVHTYGKTDTTMRQGEGLSLVKWGFRLRYEFDRQFAPYFGIERVLKYGKTADLLLPDEDRADTHWIAGLKFWF
jgi:copper resistance protein B